MNNTNDWEPFMGALGDIIEMTEGELRFVDRVALFSGVKALVSSLEPIIEERCVAPNNVRSKLAEVDEYTAAALGFGLGGLRSKADYCHFARSACATLYGLMERNFRAGGNDLTEKSANI